MSEMTRQTTGILFRQDKNLARIIYGPIRPLLACAAFMLPVSMFTGCAAVGVAASMVDDMTPRKAQYTPAEIATLVLCENYQAQGLSQIDADQVGRMVWDQMSSRTKIPMISPDTLVEARDIDRAAFSKLTVLQIAKQVKARQVIYIDLQSSATGVATGSDLMKAVVAANVKLIDVDTGRVVFPPDSEEGLPLATETPMRRAADGATRDSLRTEAMTMLSGQISRLFHDYKAGEDDRPSVTDQPLR